MLRSLLLRNRHKGLRASACAALLVALLADLAVPSTVLARSNRSAVRAYLGAVYEYESVAFANVGAAKNHYDALALRIASECPGVIAGSRHRRSAREFEQMGDLREEVYAALRAALLAPEREASFTLAAKLRMLKWATPGLRRRVDSYATGLEQRYRQRIPDPCVDMKAWAASGYRVLSAATRAFLREYRPPRRLVISGGSTPKTRSTSAVRLQGEAKRYDSHLLFKVRVLKRRVALALGSLVVTDRHLESALGFPASKANSSGRSASRALAMAIFQVIDGYWAIKPIGTVTPTNRGSKSAIAQAMTLSEEGGI